MCQRAKLPINEPPKVWVSGCPSVDKNGKLVFAIMKMALTPEKCILEQNAQLLTPSKVWVSGSLSADGHGKLVLAIMKIKKMALTPQKCVLEQNT